MRALSILALVPALGLWSASAPAQQSSLGNPFQAARQACNGRCFASLRACRLGAEGKTRPETCDTGLVVCTIECDNCAATFSKCMTEAQNTDPGAAACRSEMVACAQKSLAEAQNLGRPVITFEGSDGSTLEAAVVIKGARNTREGIRAEDVWILKNHEGWRKDHQALLTPPGGKLYDRIEYVTSDGRAVIYFDITDFFGKR